MLHAILSFLVIVVLALAYRLRGGGFIKFSGDTWPRLIWAIAFAASALVLSFDLTLLPVFLVAYASIVLVPHSFAQQMGRGATPSSIESLDERWPAAWLPQYTAVEWPQLSMSHREKFDFTGMLCSGFARGLLIFGFMYLAGKPDLAAFLSSLLAITVLQAMSYVAGWKTPYTLPSLAAHTTEWAELFNGAAWGIALAIFFNL